MSNADVSPLAEKLMKSEPLSEELRHRYEEEKLALVERRLTPLQRRIGWLGLPIYLALLLAQGYRLTTGLTLPREWFLFEVVSTLGVLALGLWLVRVLLRGNRVTWQDDRAMEWIGVIGLGALSVALFGVALSLDDTREALRLHACATVLLAAGLFSLLFDRIRRTKLEMQVKLTELELRLAETAEAIASPTRDTPTEGL